MTLLFFVKLNYSLTGKAENKNLEVWIWGELCCEGLFFIIRNSNLLLLTRYNPSKLSRILMLN